LTALTEAASTLWRSNRGGMAIGTQTHDDLKFLDITTEAFLSDGEHILQLNPTTKKMRLWIDTARNSQKVFESAALLNLTHLTVEMRQIDMWPTVGDCAHLNNLQCLEMNSGNVVIPDASMLKVLAPESNVRFPNLSALSVQSLPHDKGNRQLTHFLRQNVTQPPAESVAPLLRNYQL